MTDETPTRGLKPGDWIAILGVLLGIAGLIWRSGTQSAQIDETTARVTAVERVQATDHDSLTGMRADLHYLVERAHERDGTSK